MTLKTITRIYLILALLAAMLLSPLPYSAVALVLLMLQVYYLYRRFSADLYLALIFSTMFIMPLVFRPVAGIFLAALLIIPALPLLDHSLKRNALNQEFQPSGGRRPTTILITLSISIIVVLAISIILANWTLTIACALLAAYFIIILGYTLYSIPREPLQYNSTRVRIIAGDTSTANITVKSKAELTLHMLLTSHHPWVHLDPSRIEMGQRETKIKISFTPPLSGPARLQLRAIITDPRGLIQFNQYFEPVEMHVTPRTRYAEWLARKFLEQGKLHVNPAIVSASSPKTPVATRRGIEYLSSRPYQPGDRLKDMDWKRMCKFNELVVKEYSEAKELSTIITVNLVVKDAEEADKLAYNLIMLSLTMARTSVPTALAVYDQRKTVLTTETAEAKEILKKALKLTQEIIIVEPIRRFLQPPDIRRLKRTINQLDKAKTEPAKKIAEILRLEDEAIQKSTKDHPAAKTITRVTERIHPPATVAVISGWNHDTEALLSTLYRLEKQGYHVVKVK